MAELVDARDLKSLTILVDPEDDFEPANIAIHGIRPEDVVGRPTMAKVFPIIGKALGGTAIVHHSPFDRTALAQAATRYATAGLPCTWLDSLQVARRSWAGCGERGGYGLANLASLFDIKFKHHDAAEDARCAGLLVVRAINETGICLQDWIDALGYETKAGDGRPRPRPRPHYPPSVAQHGASDGPLSGEVVVFTGNLTIPREKAASLAAAMGCEVDDRATKKTTILVVGDQDLRLTKGQEKSSKQVKCEEMIAAGKRIRIVRESDFIEMVGH